MYFTSTCKENVNRDKQKWADDIAADAERALATGQINDAFSNFRLLRSAGPRISSPILRADGTMASDNREKLRRWKEYYSDLLNRPPALHPVSSPEQLQMQFLIRLLTALHLQNMK